MLLLKYGEFINSRLKASVRKNYLSANLKNGRGRGGDSEKTKRKTFTYNPHP